MTKKHGWFLLVSIVLLSGVQWILFAAPSQQRSQVDVRVTKQATKNDSTAPLNDAAGRLDNRSSNVSITPVHQSVSFEPADVLAGIHDDSIRSVSNIKKRADSGRPGVAWWACEYPNGMPVILWLNLVFCAVTAGVLGLLLRNARQTQDRLQSAIRVVPREADLALKREMERDWSTFNSRFERLERKVDDIASNLTNQHDTTAVTSREAESEKVAIESSPPVLRYHPIPTNEGSFRLGSTTPQLKPAESVYELEYQDSSGSSVQFRLVSDVSIYRRAIKSPDNYLDTVCESENEHNSLATRIETVIPGLARKAGDGWKVERKARIKYVN